MKESVENWLKAQMPDEDPAVLQEIYAEYQRTAMELLGQLNQHFLANDSFEVIDKIAHTMKGNALMVGDNELFEVVQAWRENLKNGKKDECAAALPHIGQLVQAL